MLIQSQFPPGPHTIFLYIYWIKILDIQQNLCHGESQEFADGLHSLTFEERIHYINLK